jgi:hypothetical protein
MKPLVDIPAAICRDLKGVLSDLDGTLTLDGRVVPRAYEALWRAREAGLRTVLVTGRPAGWADHLARMWPLDAVIGENGAFYFRVAGGKMVRRWVDDPEARARQRDRLEELARRILKVVPGAALSADQPFRAADLAIDYCEDVPPLPREAVDRIVREFEQAGATVKVSSIHVNGWYGVYDKLHCMRLLASELWGEDLAAERGRYVYCGDSPNDEPMFGFFPYATAVANVAGFVDRMAARPAFVTPAAGGEGFAELVDEILRKRSSAGPG